MKTHKISLFQNGDIKHGEINIEEFETNVKMTLKIDSNKNYSSTETFPFVALTKIRQQLEMEGIVIMCKGARKDVYPSGRMLVGYNAYMLKLGKQAENNEIVSIFDEEVDLDAISSPQSQEEFYNTWLKSIE